MNWLKTLLHRRWLPPPFNPWDILTCEEPESVEAHVRSEPHSIPASVNSDANARDLLPRRADGAVAMHTSSPATDEDDSDEWLGIGACMIAPWRAIGKEDEHMAHDRRTICVSDRDIDRMKRLVHTALNIHSGVTLEYVRLLHDELCRATVMPPTHLPRDVVALNSTVWATNTDTGETMCVTLVTPDRAGKRANRVSVISPLGMALFGYAAGDRFEWGPWLRPIRLRIDRVRQVPRGQLSAKAPVRMPSWKERTVR